MTYTIGFYFYEKMSTFESNNKSHYIPISPQWKLGKPKNFKTWLTT